MRFFYVCSYAQLGQSVSSNGRSDHILPVYRGLLQHDLIMLAIGFYLAKAY